MIDLHMHTKYSDGQFELKELLNIIRDYKKGIVICSSTVDQVHNYFVDYRYVVFTKYVKAVKNISFEDTFKNTRSKSPLNSISH